MSFASILREIVDGCGGIGAALMGNDGIPIEEVSAAQTGPGPGVEVGTAGVEFGRILEEIRKASDALQGGTVEETVVRLSHFTLIFQTVDEENFVVLATSPAGNLGKARYLIRRHMLAIRQEL